MTVAAAVGSCQLPAVECRSKGSKRGCAVRSFIRSLHLAGTKVASVTLTHPLRLVV